MSNPQAGWYPDPSGNNSKLRYWDGNQWTNDYSYVNPGQLDGENAQFQPRQQPAVTMQQSGNGQLAYHLDSQDRNLRLIAFVFSIVSTVCMGWLIFPLAWCIPMTVRSYGIYKGRKPNSVAFGVCMLLFVNLVSGILLLVSKKEK